MNIRNKIENSKTLLFTSLVAVALLGATQPVSAETYTSRNFDWSGDDWPEDDWSGDGLSKYDRSGVGLSQYGWSKYGWSSDKEEWPEDWPEDDWSSDKKDETEDKTRPPYGEALGTGYEKRDDWGGPGTVATDPYTPPYGGALGTGYEKRDDWRGPGHIPKPENEQSPNPSHIPEPPQIEWPQWNGFDGFDGLSSGPSDWGQSEDTPRFPSEPRVTEKPQHTPQKNPQESDFDRGFSAGLKAKNSGRGIDFEGFQYGGWSDEYKKGYMQAFGTPYTPSAT
ncbi:inhibitor for complement Sic [Streptococcus pyogenes ABC020006345]|uniref:Sic1.68 n=1 Tax=Streptococcus pyogenes TaxID=1314 RepID=Q9JNW4_STRPY|nr:lysis inhibitor protein [Streptococcus pyogenes]AAF64837.1 Sic1.68 [Streptococcus pyogenes]EZM87501.1 inhibitor for complement Sic [Streptococcus pyogenes ABC020005716]EZM91235.1 inhibitor for complement Sic [Streptococcus pyogenes ABC020006345]EZN24450.1 inhibitor for complement Sic [Streptococcus pyogenes ABC020021452]HER0616464.1 lysis inhibitor protein [Streptococcus pyogenes]